MRSIECSLPIRDRVDVAVWLKLRWPGWSLIWSKTRGNEPESLDQRSLVPSARGF